MITHQQFSHYPDHVPEELKMGRFWVCCDRDKIPLVPFENRRASSTDPATWRSHADCVEALLSYPDRYAGVGRIITPGYVGVDLDDVRDPKTRELSPRAVKVLALLESYAEVSPSGKGIKIWTRADLERSHVKDGFEVYRGSRYFTVTGEFLPQVPATIEHRTDEVRLLVANEFPKPENPRSCFEGTYDGPELELAEFLDGVHVFGSRPDGLGAKLAIRCPWVAEHSDGDESGTHIGQFRSGALWFKCWHAHCEARSWPDFRREVRIRATKLEMIREGRYE